MKGYDDLILCVDLGSSGQDLSSRGVAALHRRVSAPRRGIAGERQSGIPRLGLSPGLAMAHVRDMGNALAALAGLKGVLAALGSAAAGRRGETRRRAGAPGVLGATAHPS